MQAMPFGLNPVASPRPDTQCSRQLLPSVVNACNVFGFAGQSVLKPGPPAWGDGCGESGPLPFKLPDDPSDGFGKQVDRLAFSDAPTDTLADVNLEPIAILTLNASCHDATRESGPLPSKLPERLHYLGSAHQRLADEGHRCSNLIGPRACTSSELDGLQCQVPNLEAADVEHPVMCRGVADEAVFANPFATSPCPGALATSAGAGILPCSQGQSPCNQILGDPEVGIQDGGGGDHNDFDTAVGNGLCKMTYDQLRFLDPNPLTADQLAATHESVISKSQRLAILKTQGSLYGLMIKSCGT